MAPANTTAFLRSLDCKTVSFFSKYLNTQKYGLSCNLFAPRHWGCFATRIPYWWRKIFLRNVSSGEEREERWLYSQAKRSFMSCWHCWHLAPDTYNTSRNTTPTTQNTNHKNRGVYIECCIPATCVTRLRFRKRTGQLPIPLCLSSNQ